MSQITTLTNHRSPQNQPHYFIRTHHLNKRPLCWSHQNKGSINQDCHKRFYRHMFFWFIYFFTFETSATASCGYTGIQYIIIPRTDLQKLRLLQKFPLIACHFHLLKGCTSMNRHHKHLKCFPKLSELQSPACFFSQCRWWRCDLRETWCEGHVAILQIYPQTSSLWQPPCFFKDKWAIPLVPQNQNLIPTKTVVHLIGRSLRNEMYSVSV